MLTQVGFRRDSATNNMSIDFEAHFSLYPRWESQARTIGTAWLAAMPGLVAIAAKNGFLCEADFDEVGIPQSIEEETGPARDGLAEHRRRAEVLTTAQSKERRRLTSEKLAALQAKKEKARASKTQKAELVKKIAHAQPLLAADPNTGLPATRVLELLEGEDGEEEAEDVQCFLCQQWQGAWADQELGELKWHRCKTYLNHLKAQREWDREKAVAAAQKKKQKKRKAVARAARSWAELEYECRATFCPTCEDMGARKAHEGACLPAADPNVADERAQASQQLIADRKKAAKKAAKAKEEAAKNPSPTFLVQVAAVLSNPGIQEMLQQFAMQQQAAKDGGEEGGVEFCLCKGMATASSQPDHPNSECLFYNAEAQAKWRSSRAVPAANEGDGEVVFNSDSDAEDGGIGMDEDDGWG